MADWRWSAGARRYQGPDGKFLSAADTAELRNDFLGKQRDAMLELGRKFGADEITVPQFEWAMRERIKLSTTTEFVYGRGGRQAMTSDDRQAIAELVKEQHVYLNEFAKSAAAGDLSPAQIQNRAGMYASAGIHAHASGEAAAWADSDHEERNIRGGSVQPCGECPTLSARGWVAGGTLPLPGSRECTSRCRCHLERRAVAQSEERTLRVVA